MNFFMSKKERERENISVFRMAFYVGLVRQFEFLCSLCRPCIMAWASYVRLALEIGGVRLCDLCDQTSSLLGALACFWCHYTFVSPFPQPQPQPPLQLWLPAHAQPSFLSSVISSHPTQSSSYRRLQAQLNPMPGPSC